MTPSQRRHPRQQSSSQEHQYADDITIGSQSFISALTTGTTQKMQLDTQFNIRAPIDEPGTIRTNDDVHTTIRLCPATKTIIDTPQMQRLRGLKQLGTAELVYTTATHTRFEHSLGVGHLAEKKVKGIAERQPRLGITEKDILCVKIAGLLHDLGHGPFSHVYDGLFRTELKKKSSSGNDELYNDVPPNCRKMMDGWKHEDTSLSMLDALLKHLGLEIDDSEDGLDKPLRQIGDGIDARRFGIYGYKQEEDIWYDGTQELPLDFVLTSRDWIFVKELIAGGPLPPKGMSIKAAKKSPAVKLQIVGRQNKEYLYDLVSNIHSGLDVDKMDYFSRDGCRTATGESAFNDFLLENAYVAKGECDSPGECWKCSTKPRNGYHLMICYQSPKTVNTAMSFFRQRFNNYKNIYEHHKTKAASYMISDIMALADPYYRLPGSKLPISLAMSNPDAYVKLKDSIIDIIELTDDENLQPAKELIERYRARKLYKRVAEQPISSSSNNAWTQALWQMDQKDIVEGMLELSDRSMNLCSSDIIIDKMEMHFGMKEENPVSHMRFLPKSLLIETRNRPEDLPLAEKVDEAHYECDTSKSYFQKSIRVFYKQLDGDGIVSEHLRTCFNGLTERIRNEYDETISLSGSVVDMGANINVCTQSPVKSDSEESPFVSNTKKRKMDGFGESLFQSAMERIDKR